MAYVKFKTVGISESKEAVEAEFTMEIGTFFLVKDIINGLYVVNSVSNPGIGWSITEEQFTKLENILKAKPVL